MRRSAVLPFLVTLTGCGLTTHVRPIPAGTTQIEVAVGGPVPEGWHLPVPDATFGVRQGLLPRWDAGLHLEVPFLAAHVLRADLETNVLAFEQQEAVPALTLTARGYVLAGAGTVASADVAGTLSWQWTPHLLAFLNVTGQASTVDPVLTYCLGGGLRFEGPSFGVQLEARWYDLRQWHFNDNFWVKWSSFQGAGAFGVVLGADYRFGGEAAPPPDPAPP